MAGRLLRGLVLLGTLWSLAPQQLSAQGIPPLSVYVAACANDDEQALELDALLDLLSAEIAPRELLLVGPQRNANLMIDGCQTDELVLSRSGVEPRLSRLALHDVLPALRPRVAALAAAELVFTSDSQPAPPPREPPADPELAAKQASAALSQPAPGAGQNDQTPYARQSPPGRLAVGGETRVFFTAQSLHLGPRAVFTMKHIELSLLALFGRHSHALGVVRTGLSALGLQVPIWHVRRRRAELTISLGGELGISWGGGTPNSSYTTSGATRVGPFAALPARLALGGAPRRSAYLRAEVGLGYAYGLTGMADGQPVSTTHGPFAVFTGLIGTRSAPR